MLPASLELLPTKPQQRGWGLIGQRLSLARSPVLTIKAATFWERYIITHPNMVADITDITI